VAEFGAGPPPTVSIVTACYNGAGFLARTAASVRAQAGCDWEWILVDDGSRDGSDDLVRALAAGDPARIRAVVLAQNVGAVGAIARGVALARGEFTLILDHDDELVPGALAVLLRLWRAHDGDRDRLLGVGGRCVDQEGRFLGTPFPVSPIVVNELDLRHRLRVQGELAGMIRTPVLRELYADRGETMTNGLFWRRAARRYAALHSNDVIRIYHTNVPASMVNRREIVGVERARAALLADLNENADYLRVDPVYFLLNLVRYGAYSRYAGVPAARARRELTAPALRRLFPLAWAGSRVLALWHRSRGRRPAAGVA
jgi:glycosyltransferase involved in cell wall biosynthesis